MLNSERLYIVDLLRVIAALAVLSHHWNWVVQSDVKALPIYPEVIARHGGYFGVALFFLISGFVILKSARQVGAGRFLMNRAIRLYPAFWICCTLSWLVNLGNPRARSFNEYLINLTMFPDVAGVRMVDGVYWTLALEAKFYILVSILICFKKFARIEIFMWAWLVLSRVAIDQASQDLLMAAYAPFFIGGCACMLISERPTPARYCLFIAALIAGVLEAIEHSSLIGLLFKTAAEPVLAGVVIASFFPLMLAVAKGWIKWPASHGWATAGAISYPLYLLHAEIGYLIFDIAHEAPGILVYPMALACILTFAWAVTRWGEMPLQKWLRAKIGASGPPGVNIQSG